MQWGKIKTLFIYLFLLLNVALITNYLYTDYKNKVEHYEEKDAILTSLKNDGIEIKEPETEKKQLSYVKAVQKILSMPIASTNEYDYSLNKEEKTLTITAKKPLANIKEENYLEKINRFIISNVESGTAYSYIKTDNEKKEIIYYQQYEGLKIFENKNAIIKFKINQNGDILSLTQTSLTNFKKEKDETIVPYIDVIAKLYHENMIPKKSKVSSELGYYSFLRVENQILIPTYKVTIKKEDNSEQVFYVDSLNAKILNKD